MTNKQKALQLVNSLPDELTARELETELQKLLDRLKLEEGLEASRNGSTVDDEEVRARMSRWLTE